MDLRPIPKGVIKASCENTIEPMPATVLIVPGLRDHVSQHWQTLLADELPLVKSVPPMGRNDLDCQKRLIAIEELIASIMGPVVIVAHSGGCIMIAHWARMTKYSQSVQGALLVTPPDFETPMPAAYPTLDALRLGGWLPVPRRTLPFRSTVAFSRNDPLGSVQAIQQLAADWSSETIDLGLAGHMNPASGYGHWPEARALLSRFY